MYSQSLSIAYCLFAAKPVGFTIIIVLLANRRDELPINVNSISFSLRAFDCSFIIPLHFQLLIIEICHYLRPAAIQLRDSSALIDDPLYVSSLLLKSWSYSRRKL